MPTRDVQAILKLRVPVIVRLAHRQMSLSEVMNLGPGALLELPKPHDEPLDLVVNNKLIGHGTAVKVGEHFGLKVSVVGNATERIRAMGPVNHQIVDDHTDASGREVADESDDTEEGTGEEAEAEDESEDK